MDPLILLFAARVGLAALLYAFLGVLLWALWRDIRSAAGQSVARKRQLGRLVVLTSDLQGMERGAVLPLLPITSLGRAPTNSVALSDDSVSLEHALLHLRNGQWWLEDLRSRNGTRLNGQPVTAPAPVINGDLIGLGRLELKVELD